MTRNVPIESSADRVIAALKVLTQQEGTEGLTAARLKNPDFVELALAVLGEQSALSRELAKIKIPENSESAAPPSSGHLPNAPGDPASDIKLKPDGERPVGRCAGMERPSTTRKLVERFGSKPVTNMIRSVILLHLSYHPKDKSVQTILKELVHAKLMHEEQRPSLVTSLNRLKNSNEFINWPDGERGQQITITSQGKTHLGELINNKLQAEEVAYLKENVSPSIRVHLE